MRRRFPADSEIQERLSRFVRSEACSCLFAFAIFGLTACSEDLTRPGLESTSAGFEVQAVEEAVAKQAGLMVRDDRVSASSCRSGEVSFRIDPIELPKSRPRETLAPTGN